MIHFIARPLAVTAAVFTFAVAMPGAAVAYHGSCAGGQVPSNERCANRTHITTGSTGTAGFRVCETLNSSDGDVQYDYTVVFAGAPQYVCTHYHTCSQVQSNDPTAAAKFC
ncbi:MAG: hypothetical protein AAFR52_13470 [Pseudomonadota bacterium]